MSPPDESLATRLERTGPLAPAEVLAVLDLLGAALGTLHAAGRIHGALRPEALRVTEPLALTVTADPGAPLADAPLWMAPEQVTPGSVLGPGVDLWAVGLIAFRLLTGRHYWNAANVTPRDLAAVLAELTAPAREPASKRATWMGCADALPPGFDDWFARCVAHDPGQRFPDAAAMTAAARDLASPAPRPEAAPVPSPPVAREVADPWGVIPDPLPAPAAPPPRGRSGFALAAAGASMLLGLALLAVVRRSPPASVDPRPAARTPAALDLPSAPAVAASSPAPIQVVAGVPPPAPRPAAPVRPGPPPPKSDDDLPAVAPRYAPVLADVCNRLGDSACVVRSLAGRARTEHDLELLAVAYQALGQHPAAARTMRAYIALFPRGSRVADFQRYADRW